MKKVLITLSFIFIIFTLLFSVINYESNPFSELDIIRNELLLGEYNYSFANTPSTSSDSYIVSFDSNISLKSIYSAIKDFKYQILAQSDERIFLIEIHDPSSFVVDNKDIIKHFQKDNPSQYSISTNDSEISSVEDPYHFDFDALDGFDNSSDVVIAVLDSGVNRNHVALQGANILEGYDAVTQQPFVSSDLLGHGTSVIGILCATKNNPTNVHGVLENSTILPINVTDNNGDISSSAFIRAIYYAADSGAKIINMSFCGSEFNEAEQIAINYAFEKGCILVAATGNFHESSEYHNLVTYPSCYDHVIGVSSVNSDGILSDFSYFNEKIDIAALGEGIKVISGVTDKATYVSDGTSYSAPYISALTSIILSNLDDGVSINSDEMEVLLRRNAFVKNNVRCVSILNTFLDRNMPIVCGIEDGKTYFSNVIITLNHGDAYLDGVKINSGFKVNYNGKHSLVIVDDQYLVNYQFTTDNIPLEFECPEGNVFYDSISISFTRGTATLNGEPYYSGKQIDKSGYYLFVLNGPYGNKIEKSFTLYLDVPEVFGVENNKTYDSDVIFKVVGNGKAFLNGNEIEIGKEIICSKNQDYALVLSDYNGSNKVELYFSINKPDIESYYLGLVDAEFFVDEQFGTAYVYSNSFDGIRIYSNKNYSDIKKIILTEGKIIDLLLHGEYIYCLTEYKLIIISRIDASVVTEYTVENCRSITSDEKSIYVLGSKSLYSFDINSGDLDPLYSFDLQFDGVLYFKAINSIILYNHGYNDIVVYSLNDGSSSVVKLYNVVDELITDDNMLYSGGVIYNSDFRIHSFVKDNSPKYFEDGCLLSKNNIFDVNVSKFIGVLSKNIVSLSKVQDKYYVLDSNGYVSVYPIKESLTETFFASTVVEDEPFYVVSENIFDTTVKLNDSINIKQWLFNNIDNKLYFISKDSNVLYILDHDFKKHKAISLKDIPSYISMQNNEVVVYFSSLKEVFVISNDTNLYHSIDFDLNIDMIVGDKDIFALSNGSVYKLIDFKTELFIDRSDISSIGYLSSLNCIIASTTEGELLKIDASTGEILGEAICASTNSPILCKGNYFIVGKSLFDGNNFISVGNFENDVLDYKDDVILLDKGIYTISNNTFTSLGAQFLYSIFDNSIIFSYTNNNEIIKYVNPFGHSAGDLPELIIEGDIIGDHYNGDVKIFFDYGIGYIDGHLFNSGDTIEDGGTHRITIMLPYGQTVDRFFNIETSIKSIEIIGSYEINVNDRSKFEYKYYPLGAADEEIIFSSTSENVSVTEDGFVYGLNEGEAEIVCSTLDGRVVSTFILKVKPFELVISNNRFEIDSSNKYLTDIPCYMRASELLRFINYNSGSARIVDSDNNVVKTHGYLSTGMWMEILNLNGEVILRYQIALNGDIDGDGYVLVNDYLMLGKHVFKSKLLADCQLEAADVTSDGKVNISDLLMVSSHLLNKNRLYSTKDEIRNDDENDVIFVDTEAPMAGERYSVSINLSGSNIGVIRGKLNVDRAKLQLVNIVSLNNSWKADIFDDGKYIYFVVNNESFKLNSSSEDIVVNFEFIVSSECNPNEIVSIELLDIETENGLIGNKSHAVKIKDDQDSTLLSELVLNNGDLKLDFKRTGLQYWITVPFNVEKIVLDYMTCDPSAKVDINNPVLDVGSNLITITVSKDDASTVYKITVYRQSEDKLSSESRAKDITVNAGTLSPVFSSDVLKYTITLDKDTEIGFGVIMLDKMANYSIIEESFGYTIRCVAENGNTTEYTFEKNIIYDFSSGEAIKPNDKYWPIVITLIFVALACIASTFILINRNKKV